MRKKITFIACNCKRCGTELLTASRSIHGLDRKKEEFGIVCSSCVTQEESDALLHSMGRDLALMYSQVYNHVKI